MELLRHFMSPYAILMSTPVKHFSFFGVNFSTICTLPHSDVGLHKNVMRVHLLYSIETITWIRNKLTEKELLMQYTYMLIKHKTFGTILFIALLSIVKYWNYWTDHIDNTGCHTNDVSTWFQPLSMMVQGVLSSLMKVSFMATMTQMEKFEM